MAEAAVKHKEFFKAKTFLETVSNQASFGLQRAKKVLIDRIHRETSSSSIETASPEAQTPEKGQLRSS